MCVKSGRVASERGREGADLKCRKDAAVHILHLNVGHKTLLAPLACGPFRFIFINNSIRLAVGERKDPERGPFWAAGRSAFRGISILQRPSASVKRN